MKVVAFFFALYWFFTIPLGRHTGWGHLVAIFSSPPAREATTELRNAGQRVVETMVHGVSTATDSALGPARSGSRKAARSP